MTSKKNLIDSINKTMDKIRDMYEKKIHDLEQELQIRTEQNADLYSKICNAIVQINEANEVIKKLYKESGNPIGCDYLEKWDVEI